MVLRQSASSVSQLGNGRDLGGLSAGREKRVGCGRLYRAAAPDFRDPTVHDAILSLGLTKVFDFRLSHEVSGKSWREEFPLIPVWRPSSPQTSGDPHVLLAECLAADGDATAIMVRTYRLLPGMLREHLAAIIRGVTESRGPLLFHCAAGKDRTGAAAAILLALAGVHRDDIYADYLRSNENEGPLVARYLSDARNGAAQTAPYGRWRPLMRAEPAYLDAMFNEIDRTWSGVETFALNELALQADDITAFRAALLD